MKTRINKRIPASILAVGLLALVASGCASSPGKTNVRVTEEKQYIQLRHVTDTSQLLNLKKGDAVAMACSKCKTVLYRSVTDSTPFFFQPPLRAGVAGSGYAGWQREQSSFHDWSQRHYCPGCKSTITTTGSWFNQKETIKHTCDARGDDSVFCCATTKDATPTGGMEKK